MNTFFLFIGNLAACILQRTFQHWLKRSCSAKLLAGGANCPEQIISLRRLTRFQMRQSHITFQIYLNNKKQEIPCQSFRVSTFFYRKASLIQFFQLRGACFIREQSKFYKSGNLFVILASILTNCHFTNEPNHEISRGIFQNRGVCRQALPLLPSPPLFHFFLLPL